MSNASSKQSPDEQRPGFPSQRHQVAWGPISAIVFTAIVYFGAQFFAGLVLSLVAFITGLSIGLTDAGPGYIADQFYFVLLSDALILLAIWLFLRKRQASVKQLGFERRPVWLDVGYA